MTEIIEMIDRNFSYFVYFISGAALLLSFLGLRFVALMPGIDRWSKRFFRVLFIVLILLCLSGLAETVTRSYPVIAALKFILILESLFLSLPFPMMTAYLLHCCGESLRSSRLFRAALSLWAVFFALLAGSPFTHVFYYYTPDGQYHRGPWYPIAALPITVAALLTLAGTIRRRKRLSPKVFHSFLITLLPVTAVLFVQMFTEAYPLLDICIVLSALSMYGRILSEQVELSLRQKEEIAHQRANIMVLQMRPHFICNAMTSIYYLCDKDPKTAKRVTMDFTAYLRRNFNAIASREPIPFSDELEHTRAYLAIEQVQFKDSLFVDYDTPHTGFCVPPLTLQPIVENAVKHGMDPESTPLRISIRTRKTDLGSEIIVEDNGPGFDPAGAGGSEPHIAMANIRQRLEMMCGGKMTIMSVMSGDKSPSGTVVKVTIPACKAG